MRRITLVSCNLRLELNAFVKTAEDFMNQYKSMLDDLAFRGHLPPRDRWYIAAEVNPFEIKISIGDSNNET